MGNLTLDSLVQPFTQNRVSKVESSGKFRQQLLTKQKVLEEQLIFNRVKKLQADQQRLLNQLALTNKKTQFADSVIQRKMDDIMAKHRLQNASDENRASQIATNLQNRQRSRLKIE